MFPKGLTYISGNAKGWDYHFNTSGFGEHNPYHFIYSDPKNEFVKEYADTYDNFYYIVEEFLRKTFQRNIYRR